MPDICIKCKEEEREFGEYCIDCWPGYDNCCNPKCRHYRCEHALHLGPAIYIKPGIDPATVPDRIDIEGCANNGCPCEKFVEPSN